MNFRWRALLASAFLCALLVNPSLSDNTANQPVETETNDAKAAEPAEVKSTETKGASPESTPSQSVEVKVGADDAGSVAAGEKQGAASVAGGGSKEGGVEELDSLYGNEEFKMDELEEVESEEEGLKRSSDSDEMESGFHMDEFHPSHVSLKSSVRVTVDWVNFYGLGLYVPSCCGERGVLVCGYLRGNPCENQGSLLRLQWWVYGDLLFFGGVSVLQMRLAEKCIFLFEQLFRV